ncbi:hypothetical protein KJ596_02680, partial [Patescibacteria group bacterium]|nr:hypothetical protein [Patescibacteria group bacterium]
MLNKIKSASGGKKVISALLVLVICVVALVSIKPAKADEAWDLTGTYTIDFVCTSGCSGTYTHQMNVSGMDLVTGDFSGTGKYYTGTPTWTHTGNVSGSNVGFQLVYDGSAYYVDVVGTIASDGSMSGTAGNASQAFDWSTTTGMATFNRHAEITAPSAGDVNTVSVDFEAYLVDDDQDSVQWAVRQGTCDAGTNTVFGNVDGFSDSYGWVYNSGNYLHTFTATADTSAWSLGMYCFVFNPAEDSGESEIRLTRQFQLIDDTAPLVTIDSPIHGAYVSGTVGITATIVEDRELSHYNISVYPGGADYMDFSLRLEGETKYVSSGFGNNGIYDWDTTSYDDGEYLIRLAARDAAGNRDLSVDAWTGGDDSQHVVTVYVDNDGDGVFGEADFCPGTEELDDYQLFPNRWRESESGGKRQVSQVGESDVFTTTDTHGCSCEQINDLLVGKSFIQ